MNQEKHGPSSLTRWTPLSDRPNINEQIINCQFRLKNRKVLDLDDRSSLRLLKPEHEREGYFSHIYIICPTSASFNEWLHCLTHEQ